MPTAGWLSGLVSLLRVYEMFWRFASTLALSLLGWGAPSVAEPVVGAPSVAEPVVGALLVAEPVVGGSVGGEPVVGSSVGGGAGGGWNEQRKQTGEKINARLENGNEAKRQQGENIFCSISRRRRGRT